MRDDKEPKCYARVRYCVKKDSIVTLTIKVDGPVQYNIIGRFSGKPQAWKVKNQTLTAILNPDGSDLTNKEVKFNVSFTNNSPNAVQVKVSFELEGGTYRTHDEPKERTIEVDSGETITCFLTIKFFPAQPQS